MTTNMAVVPVEPTPEMLSAGWSVSSHDIGDGELSLMYRAMLSAAPLEGQGDQGSSLRDTQPGAEGAVVGLRAANAARQVEWDAGGEIDAAYRGNELAGEVGEACNVIKKLERERRGIRGSRATVQDLADELADVVICTDLIAMQYGIDLDAAVERKFNATSEKVGLVTRLCLAHQPPVSPAEQVSPRGIG